MTIWDVKRFFWKFFHAKRMPEFVRLFGITPETTVLDVGGTVSEWKTLPCRPHVTALNLSVERAGGADITCVVGDARHLPFKDGAFDVVFSNSVVEHVGSWSDQQLFAAEVSRVGRSYYVQTPNRWFFVETHFVTPFIHFLPRQWQRPLLRNFTVWGLMLRPTSQECDELFNEIRLLSKSDMKRLFVDGKIITERFLGMSKSLMAVRLPSRGPKLSHAKAGDEAATARTA
jgi:hypothetical protein